MNVCQYSALSKLNPITQAKSNPTQPNRTEPNPAQLKPVTGISMEGGCAVM
jgi:hypothetical protein